MGTKVNSNYEDLISFVRASSSGRATALRPVSYGDELVDNGDFELGDNGDWTLVDATISGGLLNIASATTQNVATQSSVVSVGITYRITVDVTVTSGAIAVFAGQLSVADKVGSNITSSGSYDVIHVPTGPSTDVFFRSEGSFTGTIDNISVKEVLFDQPDGTLTLFEHPENVPRVEYDADGNRLGLLVEESRTNLFAKSNVFKDGPWNETGAVVTPDAAVGPDGKTSASYLKPTAGDIEHRTIYSFSYTADTYYTISVFAKKAELNYLAFRLNSQITTGGTASWGQYVFDLENGVLGVSSSTEDNRAVNRSIQDVGNGWYRCSVTVYGFGSSQLQIHVMKDNTVTAYWDGTGYTDQGIYIYGAQLEEASFPTSYIKNEGTFNGVTRSADVVSIPVADFGYNQSAGTVVAEVVDYTSKPTGSNYVVSLDDNTASNRNQIIRYNNAWIYDVKVSNVTQVSQNLGTTNDPAKVAFAFKLNDFAATEDGDAVVTDTSGTVPNVTKMTIGSAYNNSAQLNGHIKKLMYIPRRVTNAQLISLTE